MLVTGKIEVFKNNRGYYTGVIKAWDNDLAHNGAGDSHVLGKVFIDVNLPKDVEAKAGETLTLDVKEGYLNARHIAGENEFTKLAITIVKCDVVKTFTPKETKAKKGGKR